VPKRRRRRFTSPLPRRRASDRMAHVSFGQAAACPAPAALSRPPRRAPRRDLTVTRAGAERPHECDAIATNSPSPPAATVSMWAAAAGAGQAVAAAAVPPPAAPRRDYPALFARGANGRGCPPLFLAPMEGLGRGLHTSTFQLNLSAVHGIGGARRGCVARVKGVSGGVQVVGCILVSDTAQVELRSGRV